MSESDILADTQSLVETGCPNDCGLIAASAHAYLKRHGVKSKILNIQYSKNRGHCIVVYKSADVLSIFDANGTMNVRHGSWRTKPLVLAKLYTKMLGVKIRVRDAVWHDRRYSNR